MNQFKALVASILVTGLIAGAMVVIGGSALFNRPMVSASAASDGAVVSNTNAADVAADAAQLRVLVNQYQAREKELGAQLDDLNKQLDERDQQLAQANQQLEQYQNLLQALQERGVIQITADGRIRIRTR